MNNLELTFSQNISQVECDKDKLIKDALKIYEIIYENQNKLIDLFEKNKKEYQRAKEEKIKQIKIDKFIQNKKLNDEIEILENKILSKLNNYIKNIMIT